MPVSPSSRHVPCPLADTACDARSVDALLDAHTSLIARIKLSFGMDHPSFARDVLPLIRGYADYVHWLPATSHDGFSRPGGLFQLGMETAFFALQGTDAHIFSGEATISARQHLEPRWRRATFIGGLCAGLHHAIGDVEVRDGAGTLWPCLLTPLAVWLEHRDKHACMLRWRPSSWQTRSLGLLGLPLVVPRSTLQFLGEVDEVILTHLLASLGGLPLYRGRNVLDDLVRRARALVIEGDRAAGADPGLSPPDLRHQVGYLVDTLQRLIATESAWQPNQDKSRVWYAADGLYLVWPATATDLLRRLNDRQLAGMPQTPDAVLHCLGELTERAGDGSPLWTIFPPGASEQQAIKIASPALLLSALETLPQALTGPLARGPDAANTAPPSPVERQSSLFDRAPPSTNRMPTEAASSGWQLHAPLRLSLTVQHALAAILAAPAESVVLDTRSDSLFIPTQLFETQGVAPSLAIRALLEVGMLAVDPADSAPTVRRATAEGSITGICLKRRFLEEPRESPP